MTLVHRLRAIPAKLRAFEFRLSRRLLFAWIKPTFLGCNREALGIDDDKIVCYVLPFRSIADLMVADMACERFGLPRPTEPIQFPPTVGDEDTGIQETRSFFFLGHPEGTFGRRTLRQQSARMTRLIEHQALLDSSVRIIPISLFWGHQPDREKSIFKLLLSENWTVTSRLKKFLAIVFHPNHILVQFGKPFFLDDLLADETDRGRQTRRLMRLLRVHFNNQKQAIIGPDLSHRRTLLNNMLESDDVQKAIERESRTRNLDYARAEKRARAFAHEIASDQSYRVIRFFDVLLTWLWNNLYDGIEVNGIDTVKELAESHEIVYTPCHRSHIDYLLLSYVLYYNGLTPPHIAAGKNLNLPVVGPLLRRAGAFFMRRSFQGDALYRAVFDEYLHQMFTKGYSVEYFIEGSRSRTGRTLPPRTGMVSMTVRSFQRDDSKPIAFLPVYFGYERVLESSSYLSELSGKSKKGESLLDLFKIFSSFKHEFGQVTVNFGEPVLLRGFLDENVPGWQEPGAVSSNEMAASCAKLATRLAKNINAAVAVKATNLVALALLSTERQLILEQHLEAQVGMLREIARGCAPAGYSVIADSNHDIVDTAIRIFGLEKIERPFGTIINASQEQAVNLTYNANNVLHIYALPSLICRFARTTNRTDRERLKLFIGNIYPYLRTEMFLPWDLDELPGIIESVTLCLISIGVIVEENGQLLTPSPESRNYDCLQDVATISDATLERFYIVIALLQKVTGLSLKELETTASGIAAQLSMLYGINSPDFFEKSLFSTFLTTLKQQDVISAELIPKSGFDDVEHHIARTLNPDVRYNILQAIAHYTEGR